MLRNFGDYDATATVADQNHGLRLRLEKVTDEVAPHRKRHAVGRRLVTPETVQVRCDDFVTECFETRDDLVPAPGPVPRAVYQQERAHKRLIIAWNFRALPGFRVGRRLNS